MDGEISGVTKTEVLKAIRNRYRKASKKDKSRMLDEFVAIMGCHRKHAVRLLRQGEEPTAPSAPKGQRIYGEAVREALTVVWEASERSLRSTNVDASLVGTSVHLPTAAIIDRQSVKITEKRASWL